MGVCTDLRFVKIKMMVTFCGTSDDVWLLLFQFSVRNRFGDSCTLTCVAVSKVHLPEEQEIL
jgi:hypothetical protein